MSSATELNTYTVRELIDELSKHDPDLKILGSVPFSVDAEGKISNTVAIQLSIHNMKASGALAIIFNSPPVIVDKRLIAAGKILSALEELQGS